MKFVRINVPRKPRSKNYIGAATASTVRQVVASQYVGGSSSVSPGGGNGASYVSFEQVGDVDYPR